MRRLGRLVEYVHAPVYFAPEPQAAYAAIGLRGYWRGYFASRAAPLGPVGAERVTELFGGFAPGMVARAIPEVWGMAAPPLVCRTRADAAVRVLDRIGLREHPAVTEASSTLRTLVADLDVRDRPMAAALVALDHPDDPLASLWHDCTVLRELRGDAHLTAVADHGLVWPEPHLLLAGLGRLDPRQREYRGWSVTDWEAARSSLDRRGLDRAEAASSLVEQVERATDSLVTANLPARDVQRLEALLEPLAVIASSELPFPNAVGLEPPAMSDPTVGPR